MEDDQWVEEWAKLIEAIGGLVTGLAWPVAVVLAVWLIMRRHNAAFGRLIDRVSSLQFPGGQLDLNAVVEEQQAEVAELANRASKPDLDEEAREDAVKDLAEAAEELGRMRVAVDPYLWQQLGSVHRDILALVAEAKTDTEIAKQLDLPLSTIRVQMRRMYEKLRVRSQHELYQEALRYRHLSSEEDQK